MQTIEPKIMQEYDVIVIGGGVAGVAASVAASRNGAQTLLIEKTVVLGGLATIGLINWYEPLCDGEGNQMVTGLAEELIKLSVKYGFDSLPEKWGGEGTYSHQSGRYATQFSPNIFALAMLEFLEENNVSLRLDSLATYPDVDNGLCRGVVVETVGGREYFPAKMIIDSTGDACICHRAGLPTELGENYFSYLIHEINNKGAEQLVETSDYRKARQWKNVGSDQFGNGHPLDKTIRVIDADDVTEYMVLGGKKVLERIKEEDKNSREIVGLPMMPQFRKIRRIIGEVEFDGTENDVVIEESVGTFGDFRKIGRHFQLPYGTLYNKRIGNLFAAGRVISAKDDGWELTRVIPVAVLSGEAAGTAAALCAKNKIHNYELDINVLQDTLRKAGVKLEF